LATYGVGCGAVEPLG